MSKIHIVHDCKVCRGTGLVFFPELGSFLQCSACVDKIIGDLTGEVKRLNKVAEDLGYEVERLQREIGTMRPTVVTARGQMLTRLLEGHAFRARPERFPPPDRTIIPEGRWYKIFWYEHTGYLYLKSGLFFAGQDLFHDMLYAFEEDSYDLFFETIERSVPSYDLWKEIDRVGL